MMLSILSCVCWQSVYLLWRNVYLGLILFILLYVMYFIALITFFYIILYIYSFTMFIVVFSLSPCVLFTDVTQPPQAQTSPLIKVCHIELTQLYYQEKHRANPSLVINHPSRREFYITQSGTKNPS